jgi:hypothetical protein
MVQQEQHPSMINCAMNMGVIVGAYYIGKFCLFPLSMHSTFAAMLFLGLTIMVPYLIFRLVKLYRDRYTDGIIDFTRAFAFALLIMAFGSLLAAAGHYIYFEFIDKGLMVSTLAENIEQLETIDFSAMEGVDTAERTAAIAQYNQFIETMKTTLLQLQSMSPIKLAMGMLSNDVSWAIIVALPVALVASFRKKQNNS